MGETVLVATGVTVCAWLLAELLLQVRQLLVSRRTQSMEWRSLIVIGVLAAVGLSLSGPVRDAVPALDYSTQDPWFRLALLVVAAAGIGLRLWAIVALGRFFRGTVHIQADHQVVRTGPYRWIRHPAYSGLLLAVAALTVRVDNLAAWLLLLACFLVAVVYRIRVEERVLTLALGDAYATYTAQTSRLVPGLW